MIKAKKKMLSMLAALVEQRVGEKEGWPPECVTFYHQPKRPAVKKQMKEE